jgi:DNA-binding NarL/FixJ family response regulator
MAPVDCKSDGRNVISVLIAHGNAMSGELLAAAMEGQSRFRVVARVAAVMDVVETVRSMDVDVALISANLQDGPLNGFDAVRQVHDCRPEVRTVILLDQQEAHLVIEAFRLGVKGIFSPSQSEFKMLCHCVERVYEGQIWANSSQMGQAVEALAQLAPLPMVNPDRLQLLTKREKDVVHLLAESLTNREIARELNLSEHTIKNYLFRMFDKVGVSNRVELVLYAVSSAKGVQIDGAKEHQKDIVVSDDSAVRKLSASVGRRRAI